MDEQQNAAFQSRLVMIGLTIVAVVALGMIAVGVVLGSRIGS